MKPLIVRYERRLLDFKTGRWQMQAMAKTTVDTIREKIESGEIDELVIVGPAVCTGWRLEVNRAVRFVERPIKDMQDAIEQRQASVRVTQWKRTDS